MYITNAESENSTAGLISANADQPNFFSKDGGLGHQLQHNRSRFTSVCIMETVIICMRPWPPPPPPDPGDDLHRADRPPWILKALLWYSGLSNIKCVISDLTMARTVVTATTTTTATTYFTIRWLSYDPAAMVTILCNKKASHSTILVH